MFYKLLPAILFGLVLPLASQTPTYQWHTFYNYGEAGWAGGRGKAVATDADGNIYVTGATRNWNAFAPAGHVPVHAVPAGHGQQVVYVMKLNPAGQYQWHTFFACWQDCGGEAIAVDGLRNVYVTGRGEFRPDGLAAPLLPAGGQEAMFVVKLNRFGDYHWHMHSGNNDTGKAIAVDMLRGYIYVTGSRGETNFVLALDTAGTYWWLKFPTAGNTARQGRGVGVDAAGNIYIAAHGWNGTYQRTMMKLHAPGSPLGWGEVAWALNDPAGPEVQGIAVDAAGNSYHAGYSWGAFNGPGNTPPLYNYVSPNGYAGYIYKVDPNGLYLWHTHYGSDIAGIALDAQGGLYAVGHDLYTAFSGPGGQAPLHNSGPGHFLVGLTSAGAYRWHTFYGSHQYSAANGIALDSASNVYLTGNSGVSWLGDNNTPPLLPQSGGSSVFVQKFALRQTPVITWSNPSGIVYGSALGPMQLNATASVPGTFVYTPPAGTVLPAGNNQTLSVVFTPTDTANYNTAAKSVLINVLAQPPSTAARIVIAKSLTRVGGQIIVNLTISNTGGTAAQNVQLSAGRINTTAGTPLPQQLGAIAPGASVNAVLTFPGSVGNAGVPATLTVGGAYTGGSFNSASRIRLP